MNIYRDIVCAMIIIIRFMKNRNERKKLNDIVNVTSLLKIVFGLNSNQFSLLPEMNAWKWWTIFGLFIYLPIVFLPESRRIHYLFFYLTYNCSEMPSSRESISFRFLIMINHSHFFCMYTKLLFNGVWANGFHSFKCKQYYYFRMWMEIPPKFNLNQQKKSASNIKWLLKIQFKWNHIKTIVSSPLWV